ncbi:hypothetical protein [Microbulbifer sp. VAAF005]|uniref:hypothetical protein n=1 Tax=Microbulbifer sp. VAAF005 TaxID=3034230 RepID=UPI0024ADC682|nr:hypothetical protein [Microbulbifer sp. VAAF005]WHI48529.1 hypothetical protein P0078_09195 [Microbulbifer sp. VAAF005]
MLLDVQANKSDLLRRLDRASKLISHNEGREFSAVKNDFLRLAYNEWVGGMCIVWIEIAYTPPANIEIKVG